MYRNLVTFGRVVFVLCKRTDRQTDMLVTILRILHTSQVNITQKSNASRLRYRWHSQIFHYCSRIARHELKT